MFLLWVLDQIFISWTEILEISKSSQYKTMKIEKIKIYMYNFDRISNGEKQVLNEESAATQQTIMEKKLKYTIKKY